MISNKVSASGNITCHVVVSWFCYENSETVKSDLSFIITSVHYVAGFLTECYDELGTRYQVPVYCLSYPINIVKEDSGRDSPAECSG